MFPTGQMAVIQEWLIGDVFLKNVYSVFDFGTNAATGGRIGFAQLGSGGSSSGIRNRKASRSSVHLAIVGALSAIYLII
jgi:putative effector of murein hydrolase